MSFTSVLETEVGLTSVLETEVKSPPIIPTPLLLIFGIVSNPPARLLQAPRLFGTLE